MELNDVFGLKGKNVLITGTGSGMGHAAAELLVNLGAHVWATAHRHPLDLPVEVTVPCDLSTKEGCDAFVEAAPENIEALFLCHGTADEFGRGNALQVQLTNFWSFKYLTEELLPRISDEGSVSFISSNGGKFWRDDVVTCLELCNCSTWDDALAWYAENESFTNLGYTFSKECQHAYVMSRVHDPAFIERKIRLNALAPGLTRTGLTDAFNRQIDGNAENGRRVIEELYLSGWDGRYASPEEMGWPLVAMGSRLFSYMSGQIIYVDYGCASVDEMELLVD